MVFFLPYRIERPFRMPWVTIGIMIACTLAFVLQLGMGMQRSADLLGFRLNALGGVTWFTAMFMHGGVMHLTGNMYFLWVFGGVLEDAIGRLKYSMLYLAGGLVAALTHALIMLASSPEASRVPMIGASGAIAAIMGVSAVRFYRLKLSVVYIIFFRPRTFQVSASFGVLIWVLNQLLSAFLAPNSGVANWAHIGGVVFGAGVAYAFGLAKDLDREEARVTAASFAKIGRTDLAASTLAAADATDEAVGLIARAKAQFASAVGDPVVAARFASDGLQRMLAQGRRDEAVGCYLELCATVIQSPAADSRALNAIGTAAEATGRMAEAARAYYDVVRFYPQSPEVERALFRLAHVYLALGQGPQAEATYRAFVSHFPASVWRGYADPVLAIFG